MSTKAFISWPAIPSFFLLFLAASATVQAQTGSGDNFTYSVNPGNTNTITLTSYTGPGGKVVIPTTINNYQVTELGAGLFGGTPERFSYSITSIFIPEGVTSIDNGTCGYLTGLTSVTIPYSVTNIGAVAFAGIPDLGNVTIPGPAVIGSSAFGGGTGVGTVLIPHVVSIGQGAFYQTTGLSSIIIPASCTYISDIAFQGDGISQVFFAGNAPTLGYEPFNQDTLTAYILPGTTGWSGFTTSTGLTPVLWEPSIETDSTVGIQANQFGFNITNGTTTNIPITVEACTNLANPTWVPVQTVTLTNGFRFNDPNWMNYSNRFYGIGFP